MKTNGTANSQAKKKTQRVKGKTERAWNRKDTDGISAEEETKKGRRKGRRER